MEEPEAEIPGGLPEEATIPESDDHGPAPDTEDSASFDHAAPPSVKQKPGALTRKARGTSSDSVPGAASSFNSQKMPGVPEAWAPGHWNKFARDLPHSRPKVKLSKMTKSDRLRVQQWEEEKRQIRERDRLAQMQKRVAEEKEKKAIEDAKRAERRAALEQRIMNQKEKIRLAMQERQRREEQYQELLERTRENGLLHDKLQAQGEKFVEEVELAKKMQYKDTVGKVRRLTAKEIQEREELHPALKQMQRRQMAENYEREARKEQPFVTSRIGGNSNSRSGSGFGSLGQASGIGQLQPGRSLGRTSSVDGPGMQPPKTKPKKKKPVTIDRASSPLLPPGVEIYINGRPYEHASLCDESVPISDTDVGQHEVTHAATAAVDDSTVDKRYQSPGVIGDSMNVPEARPDIDVDEGISQHNDSGMDNPTQSLTHAADESDSVAHGESQGDGDIAEAGDTTSREEPPAPTEPRTEADTIAQDDGGVKHNEQVEGVSCEEPDNDEQKLKEPGEEGSEQEQTGSTISPDATTE